MQNTPEPTKVNAIISFTNETPSSVKQDVELTVSEKNRPDKVVFRQLLKYVSFPPGKREMMIPVSVSDAKLWDLDTPELYTCNIQIKKGKNTLDRDKKNFGSAGSRGRCRHGRSAAPERSPRDAEKRHQLGLLPGCGTDSHTRNGREASPHRQEAGFEYAELPPLHRQSRGAGKDRRAGVTLL